MKGGKEEWKAVEPLFPKLHLNEVDKGGPRAPPRNKMAVSHQYSNLLSSRRPPEMFQIRPLPTSTVCPKGSLNMEPEAGSLNMVCSTSQRPIQRYNAILGGSSVGEFSNLPNQKNDEDQQQILLNLMKRPQPYMFRSCGFSTTDDDKQNPGDMKRDNITLLPPFPRFPGEFHDDSCLKHRKETRIEDQAVVDLTETTDHSSSKSRDNRYSTTGRSSSPVLRKREFSETEDPSWYFTNRDLPLTPEDVVRVIGRKPFLMAKQTLLHHQQIFADQIFELHRLAKVQKFIFGLHKTGGHNSNFDIFKPSIKCPMMKKLSHVAPLDAIRFTLSPTPKVEKANPLTEPPTGGFVSKHDAASCYYHLQNQWLVPVISPSEGLIYKPYSFAMNPGNADLNGVTPSNHHRHHHSHHAVEREALLPLFPTTPSSPSSSGAAKESTKCKVDVIKVVPHNPKMASEAGKRIFQFILEERTRNKCQQLHS